ncbi:hypothetical protein D3C87_2014650 [compost metagenome]
MEIRRVELTLLRDGARHWRRLVRRRILIGRDVENRSRFLNENIRVHAAGIGDERNLATGERRRCNQCGRKTGGAAKR